MKKNLLLLFFLFHLCDTKMVREFRHSYALSSVVLLQLELVAAVLILFTNLTGGAEYRVGGKDYGWSIPLTNDFYTNWSSSHSFSIGDTLVFDFDPDLHNLYQVSRRDYDSCTANQPYKVYEEAPAVVGLVEDGVFYFMCSILNYCSLGQKLTVSVNKTSPALAPTPAPSP